MADTSTGEKRYELPGGVVLEPTEESRLRLARLGIESRAGQDACYDVLARELGTAEASREAEREATTSLIEGFIASRRNR